MKVLALTELIFYLIIFSTSQYQIFDSGTGV